MPRAYHAPVANLSVTSTDVSPPSTSSRTAGIRASQGDGVAALGSTGRGAGHGVDRSDRHEDDAERPAQPTLDPG